MDDFFFETKWASHLVNPEITLAGKCEIKILLVADNEVTFESEQEWNLKVFVDSLLEDLPPWVNLSIDKANIYDNSTTAFPEANVMLNFDFAKHDLSQYQSIWLFGAGYASADPAESALGEDAMKALTAFMDNGGGVFATGDHGELGAAIAGHVPRVRTMRRWFEESPYGQEPVPPQVFFENMVPMNTLVDLPNGDLSTHDDIYPQVIEPKLYSNNAPIFLNVVKYPHPVLCGKNGILRHLPDHMHEGICEVPPRLDLTYVGADGNTRPEYPLNSFGVQEVPEVIALGANREDEGAQFGVIAVFDGHKAKCGRVLVDSTWHHFFDENIGLFNFNYQNIKASLQAGYPVPAARLKAFKQFSEIREYYHNILFYLCTKSMQNCLKARGLLNLAHLRHVVTTYDLASKPHSLTFFDAGAKAMDALNQVAPQCEVSIFASMYLEDLKIKKWFSNPSLQEGEKSKTREVMPWLDAGYLQKVALGGALFGILEIYHPRKMKPGWVIDTKSIMLASRKGAGTALAIMQEEMSSAMGILKDAFGPG